MSPSIPETMRAVAIHNASGPVSALHIATTPTPSPSPTQALIKVSAFGINRADCLQREGKYPMPPHAPQTLGLEFAGTIVALGDSVNAGKTDPAHHWTVGDQVFGLAYGGCYAEYVPVDARMLLHKPRHWEWATAAGVCETWFTALQALHLVGGFAPGRTRSVVWHAGASSVSIAGIQLSKAVGEYWAELQGVAPGLGAGAPHAPRVYSTARSEAKCAMIRDVLKADVVVNAGRDAHASDWDKEIVRENGGQGVDLVIDYVGASYFEQNLNVVGMDGRIVQLATLGGIKLAEGTDISAFVRKRVRFEGSTLRSRAVEYQEVLRNVFERVVLPRIDKGQFDARIERVYSWQDVQKAHAALENNETSGKVVCVVD